MKHRRKTALVDPLIAARIRARSTAYFVAAPALRAFR